MKTRTVIWSILLIASLFECVGTTFLKISDGGRRGIPAVICVVAMTISVALLAIATRELPVGTAYAVWTGVGSIGTVLVGITFFGESGDRRRWASLGLIILGVALLRWSEG